MSMQSSTTPVEVDREEIQWVARARTGDQAAYRWLMERYRFRAIRLAAHVLRRDSEAEDIAQDAFIQAFKQIKSLRIGARFGPWLFRIVVNKCLDEMRLKRWVDTTIIEPEKQASSQNETVEVLHRVIVEQILKQLSPPIRAALVLRELEGLEYDEIATALDIPLGTVRSRLSAARAQFRTLWDAVEKQDA